MEQRAGSRRKGKFFLIELLLQLPFGSTTILKLIHWGYVKDIWLYVQCCCSQWLFFIGLVGKDACFIDGLSVACLDRM